MLAFGLTLVIASCASQTEDVALPAPQPELTDVTGRVFSGVSPERVVATVAGLEISAGHVAAYLEVFPTLTVEQAVDDLVDIFAASARATEADVEAAAVEIEHATRQAYVLEWLGRRYTRNPEFAEPEKEVEGSLKMRCKILSSKKICMKNGNTAELWDGLPVKQGLRVFLLSF